MSKINILYDAEKHLFHLSNSKISYIMELKDHIWLLHRYWGPRLNAYYGSNCPAEVKRTFAAAPNPEFLWRRHLRNFPVPIRETTGILP